MRFGWIVLLLLSFPVLEAVGIFWMADAIGGWVLLWLLLAAVAGVMLIRVERVAWGARLLFSIQSGAHPLASVFASGRMLIAGGLLIFPGFISDAIALGLLLVPGTWGRRKVDPLRPANDDTPPSPQPSPSRREGANVTPTTINGEFKREHDDRLR
ncbi:MAG: FxsA family protein [Thiobacillus sp.]|uniref:FxsA family protein n=1 Tax=Thiobacillus sp. TaxID=924 RepID=UPI0027348F20|nr:FxsA family protein [Thiobacillus sp.]MDP3420427.1 FxsA family protein [Thiobacillus sp.]MDP3585683.1 FxsA family protein [Thiobacillus sp.]